MEALNCPFCDGSGWAKRFTRHAPAPMDIEPEEEPCSCPKGAIHDWNQACYDSYIAESGAR